jgi:HEPN domain-containing protein
MATTNVDFQFLAEKRIREAKILYDAKEFDGAYYLAGYAVECAIKACIIRKLMTSNVWPERRFSDDCYKHDLKILLRVADLDVDINGAGPVAARWGQVKDWTEQSRYEHGKSEQFVTVFIEAITDSADGVLPWLKGRW